MELYGFLLESEVGTIFALSWLITWYGHVINEHKYVVRLFDFFVAAHPLMPLYIAAAMGKYLLVNILQMAIRNAFYRNCLL